MKRQCVGILLILLYVILLPGCQSRLQRELTRKLAQIDTIVCKEIADGNIPGAVILVGRSDKILYHKAFGMAVVEPYQGKMRKDTIFDIASLTKPIATATSIQLLLDSGRISLEDPVGKYIPSFACNGKEQVQIRHLLTHTSGLPAYTSAAELEADFGEVCPDKVIEKICSLEALNEPGEKFRYSCLGYITLAKIVEIAGGKGIDQFSKENLFRPLGMKHTMYNPPQSWQKNIAATEIVDEALLRGTVHDPLARLNGGISGNAGLFTTARDLSAFCSMLLNHGQYKGRTILSSKAVEYLTTPQSHGRAYGFDVNSAYSWVKGSYASEKAFCHTGYTGTSIVCDPDSETYLIILTNRVHPDDKGTSKPLRIKVADIVFHTCR